jgi:hypothetical protein
VIVRFTDVGEYVDELDRDPFAVARRVVRLTKKARATELGITAVSVVSTAKVLSEAAGTRDYDLVRFERYVGDLWGHTRDDEVQQRASELVAELEVKLVERGFKIAAGEYVPEVTR